MTSKSSHGDLPAAFAIAALYFGVVISIISSVISNTIVSNTINTTTIIIVIIISSSMSSSISSLHGPGRLPHRRAVVRRLPGRRDGAQALRRHIFILLII